MELWNKWMALVNQLESACSRKKTFFWLVAVLIGFTIKADFLGVTSIARGIGLLPNYYTCMLHFFNSSAVNLPVLQQLWIQLVLNQFNGIVRINGRIIIVGDGIKIGKEGKKMPGVKLLHQDSASNSKAEYIMGHSLQVLAILTKGLNTYFAVPLIGQIHEGIRLYCGKHRTLLDKMSEMLFGLNLRDGFYFVADKYYCSGRLMKQLVEKNIHIVTMMKRNAVAYSFPIESTNKRRGRPAKYGAKVKLFSLFDMNLPYTTVPMPGNSKLMIEYYVIYLYWRPLGQLAEFVLVRHPEKGLSIVMSTDLNAPPLSLISIYSLRFKIEVCFKQAVHQIGAFMYRFWLKMMPPKKRGTGDQYLQLASQQFKDGVLRKLHAYHLFIQLGFIAQGLLQYLSMNYYQTVWSGFGTWLRTIRPNTLPSEKVTSLALSRGYIEFLLDGAKHAIFKKFLWDRIDIGQLQSPILEKKAAA
jgi:DDE superfamily endonuclease